VVTWRRRLAANGAAKGVTDAKPQAGRRNERGERRPGDSLRSSPGFNGARGIG